MELILYFLLCFNLDFHMNSKVNFKFVENLGQRIENGEILVTHGVCDHKKNIILLNKAHWYSLDFYNRKELVYHELGHCVLNMSHAGKEEIDIMRPIKYSANPNGSNWNYLVDKMKQKYYNNK